jgi:hypothetical protein
MKALKLNGMPTPHYTNATKKGSYINMSWKDFKNKTIRNNNVILTGYADIHLFSNGPIFLCENLFLDNCNKNFLAYWFDRKTFPNIRKAYIGSHPCDHYVLSNKFNEIYLHEAFAHYKNRWWSNLDNIKIITNTNYVNMLESYDGENIIFDE